MGIGDNVSAHGKHGVTIERYGAWSWIVRWSDGVVECVYDGELRKDGR